MSQETFTHFVGDFGTWSWVVLFAQREFDAVLEVYCELVGDRPSDTIPVVAGTHTGNPSGAVVEFADSEWTMVLHRVGLWDDFDAAQLSRRLKSRVIQYHAEDTSGAAACLSTSPDGTVLKLQTQQDSDNEQELYDCLEEFEEEAGVDVSSREAGVVIDDYDSYLTSQGIPLVCVSLDSARSAAIVSAGDEGKIQRVVLAGNPSEG
ncbi:MAG: hypothetical protein KDB14_03535 [Planctomycetales bacterium]|nr:hypothetical protein [Planctomycetales bacterium]